MSQPAEWIVDARDVSFTYPQGVAALRSVSFRVRPGALIALLGANGSGKTTLLKVLMRLLAPSAGQVLVGGDDIARLRPPELYRRIGMVFQNPTDQLFAATVEQDVAFGPKNLGLSDDEVSARTQAALADVDAWDVRTRPIHQLSFGQQKRVCLAGVLAMRPPVLLLDEPTAGLDPLSEARLLELLVRLNRQHGTTIVFCTHALTFLPELADNVCVLHEGRLWREGTPEDVLADPEAAEFWLPLGLHGRSGECHGQGVPPVRLPRAIAETRQRILDWLAQPARCDHLPGGQP